MKSLSDILHENFDSVKATWNSTNPAEDFGPIPKGTYAADLVSGELFQSEQGTPGYKMVFEIAEGEYRGRKVWHDLWLTAAAIPMAKRDLGKLGIMEIDQLDQPLPAVFICRIKVSLRKDDTGDEFNKVRSFEVLRVKQREKDAFDEPAAEVAATEDPKS